MNKTPTFLNDDEVLSTASSALMFQCTFKVSEFLTIMQSRIQEEKLFLDGLECELLSPGDVWKKGRVKLRLEFCPDEVEQQDSAESQGGEDLPSANYGPSTNGTSKVEWEDTEFGGTNSTPTPNYDYVPPSQYPEGNPDSVGMWS